LLTIILLDVGGFEILRVLYVVEDVAKGWKPVGLVYKIHLASCIDDQPCIHPGLDYFFMVVVAVVVAVLLKPWNMVCYGLSTPRTLAASDFLLLLVSSVLLLLLTVMASWRAACLWCYRSSSPGSGAME
jgi:hypothetical protein